MLISELLNLHPQHLAELRSFYEGFPFKDVEIAARYIFSALQSVSQHQPVSFYAVSSKLQYDEVFLGGKHTHAIFSAGEDNTFYCYSFAKVDKHSVECIIFKLLY